MTQVSHDVVFNATLSGVIEKSNPIAMSRRSVVFEVPFVNVTTGNGDVAACVRFDVTADTLAAFNTFYPNTIYCISEIDVP
ncbi:MAG: hypothetical protein U0X76_13290 [Bacteroidia bacterium]